MAVHGDPKVKLKTVMIEIDNKIVEKLEVFAAWATELLGVTVTMEEIASFLIVQFCQDFKRK